MKFPDWARQDHAAAADFLEDQPADAQGSTLLDADNGVTLVLPRGLPARGWRFHGAFMLAPVPVLMACLALVPILGFSGRWAITPVTFAGTAICLALIWGLARVGKMLLRQPELFPRRHFVTLGPKGAAMHFSRWQIPFQNPRAALAWKQARSIEKTRVLFFPALFLGRLRVPAMRIRSAQGSSVIIPLAMGPKRDPETWRRLESRIRQKMA